MLRAGEDRLKMNQYDRAHITELRLMLLTVRPYMASMLSMAKYMVGRDCDALRDNLAKIDACLKLTDDLRPTE